MPSRKKNPIGRRESKIRIIGGHWRGRKLSVGERQGLRPTGDRMRETLFNWLAPYISGARCLDAFAGTGALGFEALSRGANTTLFVEQDKTTARQLDRNIAILDAEARVACADFMQWHSQDPFDLVFVDPPFRQNLWQPAVEHITSHLYLPAGGLIYLESPVQTPLAVPGTWSLVKTASCGQIGAALYKTNRDNPG